jgi:hypothetical protein
MDTAAVKAQHSNSNSNIRTTGPVYELMLPSKHAIALRKKAKVTGAVSDPRFCSWRSTIRTPPQNASMQLVSLSRALSNCYNRYSRPENHACWQPAATTQRNLHYCFNTAPDNCSNCNHAAEGADARKCCLQQVCYYCLVQPNSYHGTSSSSYFFDKQITQVTHAATTLLLA